MVNGVTHVSINKRTGLIKRIKIEKTELFLEQTFEYYSSPYSNSGFYLFDPLE
jgi:hypothetical protein